MGPLAAIGISSVDSLLTGMSDGGSERFDSFFARTIRENLFSDGNMTQGMDLIALNIQRAREHGTPGIQDDLKLVSITSPIQSLF